MLKTPDRIVMKVPGLTFDDARMVALAAVAIAKKEAPKLSGKSAKSLKAIYAAGEFGVMWNSDYLWIQNSGARPFTMRSLAGKVIPLWIDDPTGTEKLKNPKAKTRITASGKTQVLIFRKAAPIGSRKIVKKKLPGEVTISRSVPRSYPGAPGRIALREALAPYTTDGRIAGQIAKGNTGVRWYFPGLPKRNFLQYALESVATYYGLHGTMQIGYDFYTRGAIEEEL